MAVPNITPGDHIPSGYLIGRVSPGTGRRELISFADLGRQMIALGTVAPAGASVSLASITGTGLVVDTGSALVGRTLGAPAAGLTISNADGVSGNPTFALANDLAALEGLGSTGLAVRSAADTWVQRTITGTADKITVTDGDGVSGNPTLTIAATYAGQASITTLGTVATGTWNATVIAGQYGGTGVANTGKTITLGGNLVIAGAFATTLTVTADTNSTLPSGTHTLAGLDVVQTWSANQQFNSGNFLLKGATSGTLIIKPAAVAGTNTLTLPAGTTDFSATGATGAFVKQASAGAAFTVAVPTISEIAGLGTGVATFLATPSSANLAAAITDETGSAGSVVFSSAPTLTNLTSTNAIKITANTGHTEGAVLNVDALANFATVAKLGSLLPVYLMANNPAVGFNDYWNGSNFVFGKGSVSGTHYAAHILFNTTTAVLTFAVSSGTGNAGDTANLRQYMGINASALMAMGDTVNNVAFTSSFPAFKRSGTSFLVRLANDSGYASIAAAEFAQYGGENGQNASIKSKTELTTIAAAATTDTTIQIPANAIVIAVSVRVTVAIPTATTFDWGIAGATTRYGTGASTAANTTSPGTIDALRYYAAATAIRITPNATPAANTGRVRVTIHYIEVTAPTS